MILTIYWSVIYFKIWLFYIFLGHAVFNTSTKDECKSLNTPAAVSKGASNSNDESHPLEGITKKSIFFFMLFYLKDL